MRRTARGSAPGLVVWFGTLAYLLYQAVLFCFATPLNNLFLVYVAYLGLCFWSLVTLLLRCDLAAFEQRCPRGCPPDVSRGRPDARRTQRLRVALADRPGDVHQPSRISDEGHRAPDQPGLHPRPGDLAAPTDSRGDRELEP